MAEISMERQSQTILWLRSSESGMDYKPFLALWIPGWGLSL